MNEPVKQEDLGHLVVLGTRYHPEAQSTAILLQGVDSEGWSVTLLLPLPEALERYPEELLSYFTKNVEIVSQISGGS